MLRQIPAALVAVTAFQSVAFGQAEQGSYKECLYFKGIMERYQVTQTVEGDVDGDGTNDVLVTYRQVGEVEDLSGGILILRPLPTRWTVAYHGFFEKVYPKAISVEGRKIHFTFVGVAAAGDQNYTVTWQYGNEFRFAGDKGYVTEKARASATSSLRDEGKELSPALVLDRDFSTGWSEGVEGTGVGESVTVSFAEPAGVGLVGIMPGNGARPKAWDDNNHIHRGRLVVELQSDLYDAESNVDFKRDLGLDFGGDKIDINFPNKQTVKYFEVAKKGVSNLKVEILSVYLGARNDDTYVSEIDIVELVGRDRTVDLARKE